MFPLTPPGCLRGDAASLLSADPPTSLPHTYTFTITDASGAGTMTAQIAGVVAEVLTKPTHSSQPEARRNSSGASLPRATSLLIRYR